MLFIKGEFLHKVRTKLHIKIARWRIFSCLDSKKAQKHQKLVFLKKNCRKCRPTKSRIKENNDHTKVVRKIRFRSSFKVNESWCKQCGVIPHFSTGQNILKKILRKDELWYNQMRKAFWWIPLPQIMLYTVTR